METKTYSTHFTNGEEITPYMATGIAEEFEEPNCEEDILHAWSYLIGTRLAYSLQGWYGRQAKAIIESGVIDKDGVILEED